MNTVTFTLDEDLLNFLNEFKQKYKVSKSVIIRTVLEPYRNEEEKLFKRLIGD